MPNFDKQRLQGSERFAAQYIVLKGKVSQPGPCTRVFQQRACVLRLGGRRNDSTLGPGVALKRTGEALASDGPYIISCEVEVRQAG